MSISITKEEKENIRASKQKLISDLRADFYRWENHTLKEYILRLDDLVLKEIEAGLLEIEKSDICTHICHVLIDIEKLDITDRYVRKVLPVEHKRNYSDSELSSVLDSNFKKIYENETEIIEKDQFGNYRINGKKVKLVTENPNITADTEITYEVQKPKQRIDNKTTKTIFALGRCGAVIERIAEAFDEKYQDSPELRELIDKTFENKFEEYKAQYAKISNARNTLDDRLKWGNYEKLMAKFLIDVGATTANLAKLMDYSAKFGSIGIDKNEDLLEFYQFLRVCPNCEEDIHYIINENIERYKADRELNLKLPKILKLH